jgi:hypothetical protein
MVLLSCVFICDPAHQNLYVCLKEDPVHRPVVLSPVLSRLGPGAMCRGSIPRWGLSGKSASFFPRLCLRVATSLVTSVIPEVIGWR